MRQRVLAGLPSRAHSDTKNDPRALLWVKSSREPQTCIMIYLSKLGTRYLQGGLILIIIHTFCMQRTTFLIIWK